MMRHFIYNCLLSGITPFAKWWLGRNLRHRPLQARFYPEVPPSGVGGIWIHACSVGEVMAAQALLSRIRREQPEWPVLLTVSTIAGREIAENKLPDTAITWLPFDTLKSVRRFVQMVRPQVLVLVETEIWPNLVREVKKSGASVVVVNGRISARSLPRFIRFRALFAPAFAALDRVAVQNQEYKDRFERLGASPDRVRIAGCMKFDAVACEVDAKKRLALRVACGYAPDQPLLVFGSTRPGEVSWRP